MCYWQMHIYLSVRSVLHKCKIKNPRIDQFNACTDKIVCSITKSRIIIPLIRTESGARPKSHKKTNPGKKGVPLMEKYQLCFKIIFALSYHTWNSPQTRTTPHRGYSITLYFKMFSNTYYQADTFRSIKTKTTKDGNSGQNNCCP